MTKELLEAFEKANNSLLTKDKSLFGMNVSERTLCGALMLHLAEELKKKEVFSGYYVDVEYNRNRGGKLKTMSKTAFGEDEKIITIDCDLIVHSRGENISQDNLMAIEMKKSSRPKIDKEKDKERVRILTKDGYGAWSFDGETLPEHVCRYILGVYYEVNFSKRKISLEFYKKGALFEEVVIDY
ncbi:MAG: hypothetical protein FWE31_02060 [Firmicutes bacterium]|nr:hypothetical protein [Bacillota bacterium]